MADSSELSSPPTETAITSPHHSAITAPIKSEASKASKKRGAEEVTVSVKRAKRASRGGQPSYAEESEAEELEQVLEATPKKPGRGRAGKKTVTSEEAEVKVEVEAEVGVEVDIEPAAAKKPAKKTKAKVKTIAEEEVKVEDKVENGTTIKKTQRKRKTKEEKEAEAMPLAARTLGHKLAIGAHVSSAGGVHNAVANCLHIGGNAFALFLKSQRKWVNPSLTPEHATMFKAHCDTHKYDSAKHVVPHGSYLVNLAHTDDARTKQAYDVFLDDLSRCRELGIKLYNFHPGNAASSTREEALKHLADQLNRSHEDPSSGDVITLLETMAVTDGNTIGGTFEELKAIIDLVGKKDRVGVCLDTCHIFAAGYDIRTPETFKATIDKFDETIGLPYLKALHINDSKAPLGSCRDLHANIGTGFLGLRSFHSIMNEPRLHGLPMVLETPIDVPDPNDPKGKKIDDKGIWAREIKLLENLIGMDVESEEFKKLDAELQEQGKTERERVQDQVDRREEKKKAKETKGKKKTTGKKKVKDESGEGSAEHSE